MEGKKRKRNDKNVVAIDDEDKISSIWKTKSELEQKIRKLHEEIDSKKCELKNVDNSLSNIKEKLLSICDHEFENVRCGGYYGALYKHCKKCGNTV